MKAAKRELNKRSTSLQRQRESLPTKARIK
jgi:hypothetical protein